MSAPRNLKVSDRSDYVIDLIKTGVVQSRALDMKDEDFIFHFKLISLCSKSLLRLIFKLNCIN